jgi:hypothetical protein
MSAPQSLLQAAVNRLSARVASGLADTAATVSLLAQDAPLRLRQELELFWQEVEQEAARLDREGQGAGSSSGPGSGPTATGPGAGPAGAASTDPQEAIDALRAQVAELARRLESAPADGVLFTPAPGSAAPGRGPT